MLSHGFWESEEVDITTEKIFDQFIKPSLDYQSHLEKERDGLKDAGKILIEVLRDKDSDETNRQTQIDYFESLTK